MGDGKQAMSGAAARTGTFKIKKKRKHYKCKNVWGFQNESFNIQKNENKECMIQDSKEHMELRVNSWQVVIKSIIDNYEKRIFVDSYKKEES